jgi:hypothetical protein
MSPIFSATWKAIRLTVRNISDCPSATCVMATFVGTPFLRRAISFHEV